ncbi:MAG: hypothetical protein HUU37_06930 [Bdellovibrionales bacterium]|nr:hypothetical protein [Bdellovibrionales bacterium]
MSGKLLLWIGALTLGLDAAAAFAPSDVLAAAKAKKSVYFSDTVFWGGDALADPVNLAGVRWAPNQGFERIVVDLGSAGGSDGKLPPYFQVGVSSARQAITVSIKGITERGTTNEKLSGVLRKSALIQSAYIAPPVEGDLAALEFTTKGTVDVESFYLVDPPRIVIDVRAKN